MKTIIYLSTILLISSCAFHTGTITSNVTNEPVVHTDIAVGFASTNRVFGIGGLSKDALISQARKNMVLSRPLEGAEQYNNVEVNIKNTFYIVGHKTKITINADVIEPKDSITQATYTEEYLDRIKSAALDFTQFALGDVVYINNYDYQSGTITRLIKSDSRNLIEVSCTDAEGKVTTKTVKPNKIFMITSEYRGLTLGERYKEGVILGFGKDRVLIKAMYGKTTERYPN